MIAKKFLNDLTNEGSKRKNMHLNEIELNKTYYAVIVGNISEIQILKINKPEVTVKYKNYIREEFLTDYGIRYEEESYVNSLNSVFKTKEEAESFISGIDYQIKLQKHFKECEFWSDYFDDRECEY